MRSVPSYIEERLKKNIQTRANDSAPSASIWLGRPSNPLTNGDFLERETIISGSVTDASIAVCHPRARQVGTDIFVAYVSDGVAKVVMAKNKTKIDYRAWLDMDFEEDATAVSIAFDGTMVKSYGHEMEFVTEKTPWVFWANDGALYAQKLGGETIILAEGNCTDVSAIRAAWSQANTFDFGLVVFFILNGTLYYRQLIRNEWTDAEVVSFGPSGVRWSGVSAFRTWDFRVGVQLKSTDGNVYELFTQFMGIGTRNAEHVEIANMRTKTDIIRIGYTDVKHATEHVEVADMSVPTAYLGIYELGTPNLLDVYNIDDGYGDWGKKVVLSFDKELNNNTVQASIGSFYFIDENEDYYFPISIKMDKTGRRATLEFVDFNNARGVCVMHYDPGTVVTMLNETLSAQQGMFIPTGLVPNDIVLPEVVEILAENEIGTEVSVRFTEPITDIRDGCYNDFIVTINYPEYSPGGSLSRLVCPVVAVEHSVNDSRTIILRFADGMKSSIRNAVGEVTVQYAGTTLVGEQGLVLGFLEKFIPAGLSMKPNPHDAEHVSVSNMFTERILTRIHYVDCTSEEEHVGVADAYYVGILTYVDNI